MFVGLAIVVTFALGASADFEPAPGIAGVYELTGPSAACFGAPSDLVELRQSGRFVTLDAGAGSGTQLELEDGSLSGAVQCRDGSASQLTVAVEESGPSSLEGRLGNADFAADRMTEPPIEAAEGTGGEHARPGEKTFGRLMLAIAAVILAARLLGAAVARLGQPHVMGEVLAGILLGPTLLGAVAPAVRDYLFPSDIIPLLAGAADIGLAFYMFLVGLELDPAMLRGRVAQAAFISNASVVLPMALGMGIAVPLHGLLAGGAFLPFALFMGVSMSITAFPVLARILIERRMLKRPVGAMALASAAVDDVTAWTLLALAAAVALSGSGLGAVSVIALAAVFSAVMVLGVRRFLGRVSDAYDEAGHVPAGWIAAIFVAVLVSTFVTAEIGIAAIFGAFVMGLIMPRRAELTHDISRRLEDFVVMVLLPLFFVVTGLRTNIGLLDRPELWLITIGLIVVAIVAKWAAAMLAARYTGFGLRESAAIGALMNTRGLTELIVLNIGLELGVISPALFTMLVIMALATTFMTGPALRLIDPRRTLSARPEDELRAVPTVEPGPPETAGPRRSILVAAQDAKNLDALQALGESLATRPPRELILVHLLAMRRTTTGLAADDLELQEASRELSERREPLVARGIPARTVAFISADVGEDLVRLASEEQVDLLLLDGSRPLVGDGVPRGAVGAVLERAPCDVAVLVERGAAPLEIGPEHPVVVPFGGAEHDWAALELAAWLASAHGAPLRLLGATADVAAGQRDASRLLAAASLVVQQLAGIPAEPVLVSPGREGIVEASRGAGLLVIGLSERWRQEGLGQVRSTIARSATAPIIFARRGQRPGALAPRDSATRFAWSAVAPPPNR